MLSSSFAFAYNVFGYLHTAVDTRLVCVDEDVSRKSTSPNRNKHQSAFQLQIASLFQDIDQVVSTFADLPQ